MSKAQICPICKGEGKIFKDNGKEASLEVCHGCNGRGWIELSDDYPRHIPYPDIYDPFKPNPYKPRKPMIWTITHLMQPKDL